MLREASGPPLPASPPEQQVLIAHTADGLLSRAAVVFLRVPYGRNETMGREAIGRVVIEVWPGLSSALRRALEEELDAEDGDTVYVYDDGDVLLVRAASAPCAQRISRHVSHLCASGESSRPRDRSGGHAPRLPPGLSVIQGGADRAAR